MTQLETLKAAFDRGESLTFLESVQKYGVLALSQRCTDLRREGYPVVSEIETTTTGKRIARYSKLKVAYG